MHPELKLSLLLCAILYSALHSVDACESSIKVYNCVLKWQGKFQAQVQPNARGSCLTTNSCKSKSMEEVFGTIFSTNLHVWRTETARWMVVKQKHKESNILWLDVPVCSSCYCFLCKGEQCSDQLKDWACSRWPHQNSSLFSRPWYLE